MKPGSYMFWVTGAVDVTCCRVVCNTVILSSGSSCCSEYNGAIWLGQVYEAWRARTAWWYSIGRWYVLCLVWGMQSLAVPSYSEVNNAELFLLLRGVFHCHLHWVLYPIPVMFLHMCLLQLLCFCYVDYIDRICYCHSVSLYNWTLAGRYCLIL